MSVAGLISVVVPVYNEAATIAATLLGIAAALPDRAHEVLVCYDFDADTTLPAVAAMPDRPVNVRLVKNTLGRGAAFAIRSGIAAARGDVVVITMADLSDDPCVIPLMAEKVRAGAAVVAGSRYMPGGRQIGGPFLKRTLSRLAGLSLRMLTGVGTRDCTNTFRAYSPGYLERVTIESTQGFDISLELTVKAHLMGLEVDEVPSVWRDRTEGESRFRLWKWLPLYLKWYALGVLTDHLAPRARARSPLLFLGLWALMTLALASFPLTVAGPGLDAGWPVVLADGFARRWSGGVDTVFTYGPYGWVYGGAYLPSLFYQAITLELLFKALAALLVVRAGWALPAMRQVGFLVLCFCLVREDALLWLAFTLWFRELASRPRRPRWRRAVGLAFLAYLSLTKLTFLVLGLLGLVIHLGKNWRAGLFAGAVYGAALVALWGLAGGRLAELPGWLEASGEIVRGYSRAMGTLDRPAWEVPLALGLVAVLARAGRREPSLLDALVAFAVFKQSFVRHDAYHAGCFWTFFAVYPVVRERLPARIVLGCAVTCVLVLASIRDLPRMAGTAFQNARYLRSHPAVRAGLEAQRGLYRQVYALPEVCARVGGASVDLLPASEHALLVLNGLNYRPRPVFSYSAYTPALMELNAAHFRSSRAPEFVLVKPGTIDGRHPEADDSLAREEVARRYERVGEEKGYLIMKRRASPPAPPARRTLVRRTVAFGETVDLTPFRGTPLWLSAHLALSPAGHALTLLFKSPEVYLDVRPSERYRVVPEPCGTGFPVEARVFSFAVREGFGWTFEPTIELEVTAREPGR